MGFEIVVRHHGGSSLIGKQQKFASDRVRIGRKPDNDITFDAANDRVVSGYHAEVFLAGGDLFVQDLGSRNGTYVNNVKVADRVKVASGDILRLGDGGPELALTVVESDGEGAPKRLVGVNTLEQVVFAAVSKERDRSRKQFRATAASVAGVAIVVLLIVFVVHRSVRAKQDEDSRKIVAIQKNVEETQRILESFKADQEKQIKEKMNRYENDLRTVQGKIGANESEVARLQVEIQERDNAIRKISANQNLSESQRAALTAEAEKIVNGLVGDLKQAQAAARVGGEGETWTRLSEAYETSIFLCVGRDAMPDSPVVTGTGFVIGEKGLLATNAHVVRSIKEQSIKFVVQSKTGRRFEIKELHAHPQYKDFQSPDVGLIEFEPEGQSFKPLPLATEEDFKNVRIGTHLGSLGFPGELQQEYLADYDAATKCYKGALPTFKDGWVGRVSEFKMEGAAPATGNVIQHSASLTGGTSGSPMFMSNGKVVAINMGGLEFYYDLTQRVAGNMQTKRMSRPSPAEIGFAMRVDVLEAYRKQIGR